MGCRVDAVLVSSSTLMLLSPMGLVISGDEALLNSSRQLTIYNICTESFFQPSLSVAIFKLVGKALNFT